MIDKLYEIDIETFPMGDAGAQFLTILAHINGAKRKINELVDAVNGILDYAPLEMAMKADPKNKLDRTHTALKIAVDALRTVRRYTAINQFAPKSREAHIVAKKAIAEITALEQKD